MKTVKVDPNKKDIIKRFSLSADEKTRLDMLSGLIGMLNSFKDGQQALIERTLITIRKRLDIKEEDAPDGYERFIDIDPVKWEMLVIDRPVVKENNTDIPKK